MATSTTTIRVARETRDVLAAQARRQGISLSMMLADLARKAERDAMFRAERHATRTDAVDSAEEREWEAVVGDGIDD